MRDAARTQTQESIIKHENENEKAEMRGKKPERTSIELADRLQRAMFKRTRSGRCKPSLFSNNHDRRDCGVWNEPTLDTDDTEIVDFFIIAILLISLIGSRHNTHPVSLKIKYYCYFLS